MLGHIAQLTGLLWEHADVIAVLQAGFIGAWGEWHGSTNGLDNVRDRRDILFALLDALPPSRMVQIRKPNFKNEIFEAGALTKSEGHDGSRRARTGHHNDAFLASSTDYGTYPSPVEDWKDWLAQDSRYLPVGGETANYNPPRSDGPNAIHEMRRLNWSFVNAHYHAEVLASWQEQGVMPEIRSRLGYRFMFVDSEMPASVRSGDTAYLSIRMRNDGFAAPYNARPVYLVLENQIRRYEVRLDSEDPRTWRPGDIKIEAGLQALVPAGVYLLALWLPDEADALRHRPEYAIRLANEQTWDAAKGYNVIAQDFKVDR
ncbi:MAG: DUF4832 domain-containing protein [Planctomycetes bacterium]|nr:DUF4832 domain-containing protein [Planctomycetota bacterium]